MANILERLVGNAKKKKEELEDRIMGTRTVNTAPAEMVQKIQNARYGVLADPSRRQSFVAEQQNTPRFNARQATRQSFVQAIPKVALGTGLATGRVTTDIGQAASGLYDLASPGTGTNRISKTLDRFAQNIDQTAKNKGVNTPYRAMQVPLSVASFVVPGAAATKVAKIPQIARATAPAVNVANKVTAPASRIITKQADNLAQKGMAGRVASTALRQGATPAMAVNAAAGTAYDLGLESGKGRDISKTTVGMSAAMNTLAPFALPAAGQVASEAIQGATTQARKATAPAVDRLKNAHLIRPARLNPSEVADLQTFRQKAGTPALDEVTYQRGIAAAQKAGVDYRDPTAVDNLIGQFMTYQNRAPRLAPLNQGGYVRLPGGEQVDKPLYHGSTASDQIRAEGFKNMPERRARLAGDGLYLTTSKSDAKGYGNYVGTNVIRADVPKDAKVLRMSAEDASGVNSKELAKQGYDGIEIGYGDSNHVVMFDATKVKPLKDRPRVKRISNLTDDEMDSLTPSTIDFWKKEGFSGVSNGKRTVKFDQPTSGTESTADMWKRYDSLPDSPQKDKLFKAIADKQDNDVFADAYAGGYDGATGTQKPTPKPKNPNTILNKAADTARRLLADEGGYIDPDAIGKDLKRASKGKQPSPEPATPGLEQKRPVSSEGSIAPRTQVEANAIHEAKLKKAGMTQNEYASLNDDISQAERRASQLHHQVGEATQKAIAKANGQPLPASVRKTLKAQADEWGKALDDHVNLLNKQRQIDGLEPIQTSKPQPKPAPRPTLDDALAGKSTKIKPTPEPAPVSKTIKQAEDDYIAEKISPAQLEKIRNQEAKATPKPKTVAPEVEAFRAKIKQPKSEKQVPVSKVTKEGDTVTKTNVNPNTKAGEKRFSVDDKGELLPDSKGAYRIFTDNDGKVKQVRIGKEVYTSKDYGDLSDVNGYGSTTATMRRNVERAFGPETGEKLSRFLVDHQQAQTTQLIERRIALRDQMQSVADDLGINFGVGKGKAKKVSAAIQDFGEKKIDEGQLVEQFGQNQADKIVNADKWFRNQYDTLLDEMNETLTKYGYDPVPKRKDYYTHFQEPTLWESFGLKMKELRDIASPTMQDARPDAARGKIDNKIAGQSEYLKPNKAFNKYALRRKGDTRTADAFQAFERYLTPTLNNIYMTPSITRARVISKAVAQDANTVGKDANKTIVQLTEWANNLAGKSNRIGDRMLSDTMHGPKFLKALNFAQRRAGGNSIVGNLATAVLQPVVLAQSAGKNGYKNFLLAAVQEMSTAHGKNAPIRESAFMRRRYGDMRNVTAGKVERTADVANTPLKVVEETSARIAWNAAHNDAISKGFTGKEAIRQADISAEKTLAGRSLGERPEAFNSKTLGPVSMYQLEVNNYWQELGKEMTKGQVAKTLVAAYAFNLGLQQLTGREVGFNPVDAAIDNYGESQKEGKTGKEKAIAMGQRWLGEGVDNLPFVGQAATLLAGDKNVKKLTGTESNTGRFGVSSPVRTLVDNPWMLATPFGGGQIKKTKEGYEAWRDGALKDKDGKVQVNIPKSKENLIKGLAFGPNAMDEVNQYYANLQKKKTDQKPVKNQSGSIAGTQSLNGLTQDQQEQLQHLPEDQKAEFAQRAIEKNKATYFKDKAKEENKPAPVAAPQPQDKNSGAKQAGASSINSIEALKADKEAKQLKLESSLSVDDLELSKLSKKDRQTLVDQGVVTKEKLAGLDGYIKNKKKEFGIDDEDSDDDESFSQKYDTAYAKYEKEKDSMSRLDRAIAEDDIKALRVKKDFDNDKDVVKLYSSNEFSKEEVYGFLSTDPDGKRLATRLLAYGDARVAAGLEKQNKFRDKYGNVAIRPKAKGGSGRGRKGAKLKPSDFKLPYDNLIKSRTKGASLARSAKLARKTTA